MRQNRSQYDGVFRRSQRNRKEAFWERAVLQGLGKEPSRLLMMNRRHHCIVHER